MPLHPTSQFLVDDLHASPLLDGRFEGMRLVNFDSVADQRRGCFSLVFRALDQDTGSSVALKFFDPQSMMDVYRLNAFRREHQILHDLLRVSRCLQLASGLNTYLLQIPTAIGSTVTLRCEYFAVEWVDSEIDSYFLCQESFTPIDRLTLFDEIAHSVGVLHSKNVFHRDLKPDNLRMDTRDKRACVIPIDLGTAAKADSTPIQNPYFHTVGAGAYAAPEAHCGLAGNRRLAKYTDMYAIGCMLFELFNRDLHIKAVLSRNANFTVLLTVMGSSINLMLSERDQQSNWNNAIDKMSISFVPVHIDGAGSDVPPGIAQILNEVLLGLTHVDYRQRPSIEWVRRRIQSAIKVLRNEKLYQQRLARTRELRRQRLWKLTQRESRLALALTKVLKAL